MIYLRAGLFAEGPTDYRFLLGLLDRMIQALAAEVLSSSFDDAPSLGIDAPRRFKDRSREARIAMAIEESWDECTLFVVHGDSDGDAESARRGRIDPGLTLARASHPDLVAAPCVPVRETEAWMIADAGAFGRIFETSKVPALPRDPEAEVDPKRTLMEVLRSMGAPLQRGVTAYYADLGREVRPAELRRLSAFRRFEADLRACIEVVGRRSPA